ncbi:MAG: dNTP triphosphohydrolase, partial [Cytophagia bacterium]|nr:dNTP triphosphohydrolase [Cytophagia bacterium]
MNWPDLLNISENQTIGITRTSFDRDFDRIIFSHPFRKLQDKTQVHPLPEHDFVHNRLTHSLEVSSVGRSLGRLVGEQVISRYSKLGEHLNAHDFGVIVASASLAHDIGNPPFGHSGEEAISEYFITNSTLLENLFTEKQWTDLIKFEGNAQGYRLLNKSGYQGLRLTAPTLAAFTKYPRPSKVADQFKPRRSQKKYGFYTSEQELFSQMAKSLNLKALSESQWVRHPLAFLVEAADDICYHVIDLEDGCNLGLVSHDDTVELYASVIGDRFDKKKLYNIRSRKEQISTLRALAINELIQQSVGLFLDCENDIL